MTHIDNSKIFHDGVYTDASVLVPANTTYKIGTVLGRNADGELTAFNSTVEGSTPLYILAQTLKNESTTSETFELTRVFDSGVVDKAGLIFTNEADKDDVKVLDALKINNFRLVNVEEQAGVSCLSQ